jgi:hypothetical protein
VRNALSILPSAGGLTGRGVHEPDPQRCARAQQLLVHERRSVVDVDRGRDAAAGDAGAQRGLKPHRVLASGPPVTGEQPAVVVEECEQDRLAAVHGRAMQRVAGPPLVRGLGLEPAERLRRLAAGAGGEFETHEIALQRPLVGRPTGVRAQDRRDLRRGPLGDFLLQRHRQIQHVGRGARHGLARGRDQGVEPAAAPVSDPAVDRGPRDPHRLPERACVLPLREGTHDPAPLLRAQPTVGGFPDQGVPEQPDRAGPFGPHPFFVMAERHQLLLRDS